MKRNVFLTMWLIGSVASGNIADNQAGAGIDGMRAEALFGAYGKESSAFPQAPPVLDPLDDPLRNCLETTFPDGPLKEASINAHLRRLSHYLDLLEEAQKIGRSGQAIPSGARERLEKMCAFVMLAMMPNRQLPRWGDSDPPSEGRALLLRAAALFKRDDFRWVATGGKAGRRPQLLSAMFPEAGYVILRSGWDASSSYLAAHNGSSAAQGHFDANSIVLTAFGNELLIDPGAIHGGAPAARELARSLAHNTVTMDDQDTANAAGPVTFQSGTIFDFYDGTNAGYGGKEADGSARHRRRIVFLKPFLFLIVDDATAERPHDWTLRFHFAPGALSYRPGTQQLTYTIPEPGLNEPEPARTAAYAARGPGGLHLWALTDRKPSLDTMSAAIDRMRTIETPTASWTQKQRKSAHFATLLQPFGDAPDLDQWTIRQESNGATVAYGPMDGIVNMAVVVKPLVALEEEEKRRKGEGEAVASKVSIGIDTDADVAFVQSGPRDREAITGPRMVYAFAVTNATRLSWRGDLVPGKREANAASLLITSEKATLLEAVWRGDTLLVNAEGGGEIQINPQGARQIIVNGKEKISVPPDARWISLRGRSPG